MSPSSSNSDLDSQIELWKVRFFNSIGVFKQFEELNDDEWVQLLNKVREQARFVVVTKKGEPSKLAEEMSYAMFSGDMALYFYDKCNIIKGEEAQKIFNKLT